MKQIINIFFLIVLSFSFTSCENQPGMIVGGMLKNMFNVPAWFSSADKEYENIKKSKKFEEDVLNYCRDRSAGNFSVLQDIKDQLCQCKPWGSCDKGSCSCDVLCPTDFKIFNRTEAITDQNLIQNSLSFTNGDQVFYQDVKGYKGFCWGHANLTSKFNRLAFFDASKEPPKFTDVVEKTKYYQDIVNRVANNEPVDIAGFKNLNEFSSMPEIKNIMVEKVGELWTRYASSFQGIKSVLNNSGLSKKESSSLVTDIEERLQNNQQPSLLFNKKSEFGSAHVVLVQKTMIDPVDNAQYICIRDNNFRPDDHLNCGKRIRVRSDGSLADCRQKYDSEARAIRYVCEEEIGHASIAHNENRDSVDQAKNLHTKCSSEKDCPSK